MVKAAAQKFELKTGEYFAGLRYRCVAHYPLLVDQVTEEFGNYNDAMAFVTEHNNKGANVQIKEHQWIERLSDAGWYPTKRV